VEDSSLSATGLSDKEREHLLFSFVLDVSSFGHWVSSVGGIGQLFRDLRIGEKLPLASLIPCACLQCPVPLAHL